MKIAIKGLIGSGKSYVSDMLSEYEVFDADLYVASLYENNNELKDFLITNFNTCDKKEVSKIVFNDPFKLKELEDFILPLVKEKMLSIKIDDLIWDCPTIDKLDGIDIDLTIICTSSIDTIIKRVQKRDNRSEEEILKIIKLQDREWLNDNRTYFLNTDQDDSEIKKDLDKIIRSYNASKNWKDS